MNEQVTSDVHRLRLRSRLKNARIRAKLTQRAVAEAFDWSISKIIRIENGQVGVSKNDLEALLELYKLDSPNEVEELAQLRRVMGRQTFSEYRDIISPEFIQFLGCESAAQRLQSFEPMLIPGLLQTRQYALATLKLAPPNTPAEEVKRLLDLKERRQKILDNPNVNLHFIVDEAVIRRWVGKAPDTDPGVMRSQLRRLKELALRPHITIQVVPFAHGLHAGLHGPFVVLTLDENEQVLYRQAAKGSSITRDNTDQIKEFSQAFDELRHAASNPRDLASIVDAAAKQMRGA
jgi:transcriptional regulator with XRE-family HTH domain